MQISQQIRDATPRQMAREHISRYIAKRRAQRGDKLPTYAEFCSMLGFSLLTVQRAMGDLAKQGMVYRLHGKGCYVGKAHKASAGTLRRIGLIHNASLSNLIDAPYLNLLLSGILSACARRNIDLTILSLIKDQDSRELSQALTSQHDALVLVGIVNAEYALRLIKTELPLVLVDSHFPGLAIDTVVVDNQAAVQVELDALVALGHRRIAYVGARTPDPLTGDWIDSSDEVERRTAYVAGMTGAGLAAKIKLLEHREFNRVHWPGLIELAKGPEAPTAYLTTSAGLTADLHRWLSAEGIAVPNSVSLAGAAGVPADVADCPIDLDYGRIDFRAMGVAAIETLEKRCNPKAPREPMLVRIGVERVRGRSVIAPART
jgi:DNA-binding LacI/PurR family transcriptional regulator